MKIFFAILILIHLIQKNSCCLSKVNLKKVIKKRASVLSIAISIAGFSPGLPNIIFPPGITTLAPIAIQSSSIANAANPAPLADVGIGPYLVKDGRQHLRLSLPSGPEMLMGKATKGTYGREAQEAIELVRLRLEQVGASNAAVWPGAVKDLGVLQTLLDKHGEEEFVKKARDPQAARDLLKNKLYPSLSRLSDALRTRDIEATYIFQEESASLLAELRSLSIPLRKLPYSIPEEYDSLPRLLGRAKIEVTIDSKRGFREESGKLTPSKTIVLEIDGYHAPLTAGAFIDLVEHKFYDKLPIQRVEQLIVQTGKKTSPSAAGGERKAIPLELFYKQDSEPTYGITSDDDNRATETPVLPFQGYGALGMARDNEDPDSATSEFFFLKWLQALIAPGRNTLDGFYSCFGYVTENESILSQIEVGDVIRYAKVISGAENLVQKGGNGL